jgi:hypothetical protein
MLTSVLGLDRAKRHVSIGLGGRSKQQNRAMNGSFRNWA